MRQANEPAELHITLPDGTVYRFNKPFTVGRHSACDICIREGVVSRQHIEFVREAGQWLAKDLNSANGAFIDGQRIAQCVVSGNGQIQLGAGGPILSYHVAQDLVQPAVDPAYQTTQPKPPEHHRNTHADTHTATQATEAADLDHYKQRYFSKTMDGPAGVHTMMVRRAYTEVRKKQHITYGILIGVVLLLLIVTTGIAWYKHSEVVEQRRLAAEVFYTMRSLEIDLIKLRVEAEQRKSESAREQIAAAKARKQKLEASYDRYASSLDVYSKGLSEKEKLIMRMAHRFGECEINMPDGFVEEVMAYIQKWQLSQRLSRVIQRAKREGYIPKIVEALAEEDLPAQFFYLPVQESNLNREAVGPLTRFGHAKGMWQFIPSTAEQYGLRVGPLKDEAVVDPLDERHDFAKSTRAAARYLREIYTTDAQASGLLVMASYNWGERRVIKLIQTMPADPRERNFWKLITTYGEKVPDETYDYVFSIFTAAVIGENPRLFGFDFDNPLAGAQ